MTDQSAHDYPPPVNRLLTYGDCRDRPDWPNYLKLGLGPEHVPDLIRMAMDNNLHQAMSDSLEVWAPIHAWRALGQLHAAAAIAPLLGLLHRIDDDNDDWVGEDLPRALALIGPAAVAPLGDYLADEQHGLYARAAASRALQRIAAGQPTARADIVAVLVRQLERGSANGPELNGFLVSALLDLHATEAAPVMAQVFAAGHVDLAIAGDWEDVQIELGLKDRRDAPRPNYARDSLGLPSLPWIEAGEAVDEVESGAPIKANAPTRKPGDAARKDKARRKQAKQSRRKNRRKR